VPSLAAGEGMIQKVFSDEPTRLITLKNKFLKNNPKFACQPPTPVTKSQNPYAYCRFPFKPLGIVTLPGGLNFN
jgi:hypothetical protein